MTLQNNYDKWSKKDFDEEIIDSGYKIIGV